MVSALFMANQQLKQNNNEGTAKLYFPNFKQAPVRFFNTRLAKRNASASATAGAACRQVQVQVRVHRAANLSYRSTTVNPSDRRVPPPRQQCTHSHITSRRVCMCTSGRIAFNNRQRYFSHLKLFAAREPF